LTSVDFTVSFKVLRALNGYAFYNSGPYSGASQSHKHFQVMPFDKDTKFDIVRLINSHIVHDRIEIFQCPIFKFAHKIVPLPAFTSNKSYEDIGRELEKLYLLLTKELGIDTRTMSYNLILTESWMLVIKRSKEMAFDVLSVNSLGFLGSFLLKDQKQEEIILKKTPLEILEDITFAST